MIEYKPFRKEINLNPPNCITQILSHPSGRNKAIELTLFNHHRFAFYFWAEWRLKQLSEDNFYEIDLITYDWHQDLAYPCDIEKERLEKLDLNNLFELNFHTSYKLNPLNDNHIMSAVYLDLIDDVWVLCRKGTFESDWKDEYLIDFKGKKHTIRKFKTEKELKKALFNSNINSVYFDIDLDYFTLNNNIEPTDKFKYMKDYEIKELLSLDNELIKWILEKTEGITIALEPKFTGGIKKSLKFLSIIEDLWFKKSIGNWNVQWKHLQNDL